MLTSINNHGGNKGKEGLSNKSADSACLHLVLKKELREAEPLHPLYPCSPQVFESHKKNKLPEVIRELV
jgi:hypothetical protein